MKQFILDTIFKGNFHLLFSVTNPLSIISKRPVGIYNYYKTRWILLFIYLIKTFFTYSSMRCPL